MGQDCVRRGQKETDHAQRPCAVRTLLRRSRAHGDVLLGRGRRRNMGRRLRQVRGTQGKRKSKDGQTPRARSGLTVN